MEAIDSKTVNVEIKRKIWPILKEKGFTKFTSRDAWRLSDFKVDVINFQSFNSYIAGGVGSTTFSFSVNFGISFNPIPKLVDSEFPQEYNCHARKHLVKALQQKELFKPYGKPAKTDRESIWYVSADGSNLSQVMDDAKSQIINSLAWFDSLDNYSKAIDAFRNKESIDREDYGGRLGSPNRRKYIKALEAQKPKS